MTENEKYFVGLVRAGKIEIDYSSGIVYSSLTPKKRVVGSKTSSGYLHISAGSFRKNNNHSVSIHRLVWICSRGEIPKDHEINHKNGNKTDNRLENLECVTRSENTLHARHVLGKIFGIFGRDNSGSNNGRAVVTIEKAREIRALYASGRFTQPQLGKQFGISRQQVGNIVNNLQWKE